MQSAFATAQTLTLPFRSVAAEYSNSLDRIILISGNPNQLHIFDPISNSDTTVTLPKPPLSVSVSLDGLHAAVGHDALISYVNLQTATLEKTLNVAYTVTNLALGNNYVYIFTYSSGTASVSLATGVAASNGVYNGTQGRLHPSGTAIYTTDDGLSPEHLQVLNVSTGPVTSVSDGLYHGDFPVCGGVWFSPDGRRAYTGCAAVYQASPQDQSIGFLQVSYGSGTLDPNADGLYWATLGTNSQIKSLSESATLGRIAAIPLVYTYSNLPNIDNQVVLFDTSFMERAGVYQLPGFTANGNTYQAHGQQVFFNRASSALFVVMQADGSAGLLNDFAIQIFSLAPANVCTPTFASATGSVSSFGGTSTVGITADPTCIYQASTNTPWIKLVSGQYGSGNGSLTFAVRPNSTSLDRTGTISLGNQSFTVTQPAPSALPTAMQPLSYSVAQAAYSKALDKLILTATGTKELHIYDPLSGSDQIVALPKPPHSLSVSPDGLSAAVGYDGWLSTINLNTASIAETTQLFTDVISLVLAGNGYAYALPQREIYSVPVNGGPIAFSSSSYGGANPLLWFDGTEIYSEASKWDISAGVAKSESTNGSNSCSGPFWLTEDGARMITSCGKAYTTSTVPSLDLQYNGSFANAATIQWADESAKQHTTAVIPSNGYSGTGNADTFLQLYGDAFLTYTGELSLPQFVVGTTSYAGHGRYAFWNKQADKIVVLEQADTTAKLSADYGVTVYPLTTPTPNCTYTLEPYNLGVNATGGLNTVDVATGSTCLWTASSNASWIAVNAGEVGLGANSVTFTVSPNSGFTRTGTLTIAGQTLTVTQTAAATAPTSFSVSYSNNVTAGVPFQINAIAQHGGSTATSYSGSLQFASSDSSASFPSNAHFTNGVALVTLVLGTPGVQTVTVIDPVLGSLTISITVSAPAGLQFVPIAPCRIVDTRLAAGPFGAPFLAAGSTRSFTLPNTTSCTVPTTAQAYSLNLTVVPHGGLSYVTLWPAGKTQPVVSTLNSLDGRVKANASIVPAGAQGAVSVFTTDDTDLILDINGYFVPAGVPGGAAFYPTSPCRVSDTRINGAGALLAGVSRTINVVASGCNLPADAQAYSLNFTIVPKRPVGYLTVYPTGTVRPVVSTLNGPTGTAVANAAIVPAGTGGNIDVFSSDATDIIVDVNGYFATPASGGLYFYPLTPCRVEDTRNTPASSYTGSMNINILANICGGSRSAQAYALNATVVPVGGLGYLTLWPQNGVMPVVSTLNAMDAALTSNMAIVPTTNSVLSAFASNSTALILDVSGYFAP